jgi:hypothetical protein
MILCIDRHGGVAHICGVPAGGGYCMCLCNIRIVIGNVLEAESRGVIYVMMNGTSKHCETLGPLRE